jgi:hypothetical protein
MINHFIEIFVVVVVVVVIIAVVSGNTMLTTGIFE